MDGFCTGGALHARRSRGIQLACAVAAGIVLLRFYVPGPWQNLFALIENFSYDLYLEKRPPRDISRFVIIAIDEQSLSPDHQGRFPWRRAVYARLLDQLREADVVGIDLLFPEPSADDAILAQAIRRHGRVVLAGHKRRVDRSCQAPATWLGYGKADALGLCRAGQDKRTLEEFVPPVPELARAAAGIGYVDIVPDADGIYRRVAPLQLSAAGHAMPHFALELVRAALKLEPFSLATSAGAGRLAVQDHAIDLCSGAMLINYAGPQGTVTRHPAWKVLAGHLDPASFKDKIVIIGPTAAGLYDVRPSPFSRDNRIFYGVETNANIAHTLLSAGGLRDNRGLVPWGIYALLVGVAVSWAIWHTRGTVAAALGVGMVAVLALPVFMVAVTVLHQVVPYGAILLAAVVPMALALYERLGVERREIAQQFGTYVSPEVLRELGQNPQLVRQGQRRTVTLLFSDVRGSTTIAEQMAPDVWIAQLNEYFSEMSDAIFATDGYLDKFMGDGIMAIWNAFGTQPNHAQRATMAAAQMLERLKLLNQRWQEQEGRVPLQIGIGLHTGEAIIGNVGSDRRAQYTAIGDTVNAASRIEALSKEFKAPLVISETTAALLCERLKLVELGEAELKGRAAPVRIFKPEGFAGEIKGRIQQHEK